MTDKPVFFNCLSKVEFGNNGFCGGGGEGGVGGGRGLLKKEPKIYEDLIGIKH